MSRTLWLRLQSAKKEEKNHAVDFYTRKINSLVTEVEQLKSDNERLTNYLEQADKEVELLHKIMDKIDTHRVGSCTCITKTPDPKYHANSCTYRILMDIIAI